MEPLTVPMLNDLPEFHKKWRSEIQTAIVVSEQHDCHVHLSRHDHQVVKILGPGIQLVLYPHRTSSKNYRIRVRNESSKDPAAALRVAEALRATQSPMNSTFTMKR
jgi:hypothetical protein